MFPTATVVAVLDTSAEADFVLASASALVANDVPSALHCVHVVETMPAAMQRYLFPYACLGDDHDAIVADLLEAGRHAFLQRFPKDSPLDERLLRVLYGRVSDVVLDELQRIGPNLVAVGASSSDHPEAGVIGKNAARLARRCTAPVLVVRRRGRPSYRRFGVALDLGVDAPTLLADAMRFAHARGATVTPMHVVPTLAGVAHQTPIERASRGMDTHTKRELDRRFQQVLAALKLPFPVQTVATDLVEKPRLDEGDPGKAIVDMARDAELDLLIVYRCQASSGSGLRLGRVAEYVLRNASCDVLILPPPIRQDAG